MSFIPNSVQASGNFFAHTGGVQIPPRLEQKLLMLGRSNTLSDETQYWIPKRIITIDQARQTYGTESELTQFIIHALTADPLLHVYAVAMEDDHTSINPVATQEDAPTKQTKKVARTGSYAFDKLFKAMGDTFYTKMVIPFFDESAWQDLIRLAEQRNDPSIYRPLSIIVPSNLNFEAQVELPKRFNSPYLHIIYLENAPAEELGMLAVSTGVAMASFDNIDLGRPYKTLPIRGIKFRPANNYIYAQSDALVQAGSSWLRVDNAGQLIIGDACSTYRLTSDGYIDKTWMFSEMLANYQYKLFDMEYLVKSRYAQVIFVPNNVVTQRENVVKPSDVKLAFMELIKLWESQALSVNAEQIIQTLIVTFNVENPARIDIRLTDQMSVGGRIFTVAYSHGFHQGVE
ncbi:hypothetical protein PVA44_07735 (plasmid) [Entomospira nematocerorum]|uniref:Uncharacterized protein n=1 Tax=Entomospira nematocerorum TaxID=2719987 RepID=A0A968GGE8_9SPIO|nr:hypothetical protein [Entomospira nematocera]NIZ47803.1 hypothetical protein [Entomospira nematocera]WDI34781.1 hypothetical protein PVA44_07735 [Entomospira nematocera]